MRRYAITRMFRILAIAATVSVCSDGPSGPVAGTLRVTVTTGASARAALLRISSAQPYSNVQAGRTDLTMFSSTASSATNVAVFGAIAAGPVLTFDVPDVSKAASYTVAVIEMADASNALLPAGAIVKVER